MPSWQIVCHVSELAKTGDYVTFEFFGRRGFVIRDESGTLRAFHNVCSHRAHAVVSGERGQCAKHLTCTYHGWTYHLDGRNRSVSAPDTFAKFDRSKFGLKPIELEVFSGFVFIRFVSGEPSVAERMAPHEAELAHYRIEEMVPLDEMWVHDVDIDWKNLVENYVEDYHFPMGHPGLSALMEAAVRSRGLAGRHDAFEPPDAREAAQVLERRALREIPADDGASAAGHASPLDVSRACSRTCSSISIRSGWISSRWCRWGRDARAFARDPMASSDDRREMKAARWLCTRLNARVQAEDEVLTGSVQQGLSSGAYTRGILSDKEVVLAGFQDWIRARLPVTQLAQAPARGSVAARNAMLAT